jgi:hypothetical protein
MEVREKKTVIRGETWLVLRGGRIEQVEAPNGRITFRVKIYDMGRDAFLTETYNDESPAHGFLERIMEDNEQWVKRWEESEAIERGG